MTSKPCTLIADIGGTYVRFACIFGHSDDLSNVQKLTCADFKTPEDAINKYIENQNIKELDAIYIAAAGPIIDDCIKLTNNTWELCASNLKKQYQVKHVALLNDFEAIAYSLPHLTEGQLLQIGETKHIPNQENFTFALIGPGSGLGIASLCCRNKYLFPLVTEGGHSSFAPENDIQYNLLRILLEKFNRVTNEDLISGPGLVNIYNSICELEAVDCLSCSPATIFSAAKDTSDPIAKKVIHIFFEILGQAAGDLALTFGAYDGVFITGGIVQRYPEMLLNSSFRERFECKGKQNALLKKTPTWLITEEYPGLIGTNKIAKKNLSVDS